MNEHSKTKTCFMWKTETRRRGLIAVGILTTDEAAPVGDPDECSDECEAALDCHMRRFMTSIDAAAEAPGQSLAAIKVGRVLMYGFHPYLQARPHCCTLQVVQVTLLT